MSADHFRDATEKVAMSAEPITQEMIDCWRVNYGLDTRSPEDAARYWRERCPGMAPAGAVAALGLLLAERATLDAAVAAARAEERAAWQQDAERYRWLRDSSDPDAEQPYVTVHQTNSWGKWFNTVEQGAALDAAIDAAIRDLKPEGE